MPGLLEERGERTEDERKKAFPHAGGGASGAGLPKGVVLDKDGKPCRTCTSSAAWMSMMKSSTSTRSSSTLSKPASAVAAAPIEPSMPPDCPPDVEELGRSSWTLLHTLTASYPDQPSPSYQQKTKSFLHLFSQLYPCWVCAEDFQTWMKEPQNDPEVSGALRSQEGFGRWMCRAHNAVNQKLGKTEFDCDLWRERWKDGWKDGRCG